MFSTNYKVTFEQTDPGGILFFAEFFKIAHVVYERFLDSFNLSRNYFVDDEFAIPIVHSSADFIKAIKFGDNLTCEINVVAVGTTSFELSYLLKNQNLMAAKIFTNHVFVKKDEFKKTSIPEQLNLKLKNHIG